MSFPITANLVKFVKGTQTAYANLAVKDRDTLYFVYENANSTVGKLYLGEILISGAASAEDQIQIAIDTVENNQVLVYNAETSSWENKDLADVLLMQGATSTTDGVAGLVPAPTKDDINKFLSGDGTWKEAAVGNLDDYFTKDEVTALINGVNTLSRQKVDSLADIDPTAEDAGQHIYLVPNNTTDGSDHYTEYIVIDNKLEMLGSLDANLDGYATTDDLNEILNILNDTTNDEGETVPGLTSTVSSLQDIVNGLEDNYVTFDQYFSEVGNFDSLQHFYSQNSTIVDEVNYLNDRLTWKELK